MGEHSADDDKYTKFSPSNSPVNHMSETSIQPNGTNLVHKGLSNEMIARFIEMGFAADMISKAIEETAVENSELVLKTLFKYSASSEASSSKSSEEEDKLNSSREDSILQALIEMDYPKEEASLAIERCGENASVAEVLDFIFGNPTAPQLDEEEPRIIIKKRRVTTRTRGKTRSVVMESGAKELIHLPNPMIGFGVPNIPGVMTHRPVPIPKLAHGPPYFYYENVAMALARVWDKISSCLYNIKPEFVDSKYFCATARKRGYIHNLPIKNRFQIQPPPKSTIQEVFPFTKRWWPTWDKRTHFNCLLSGIGSAILTNKILTVLEKHNGEPPLDVQKEVFEQCRRSNLVWVGKNKVAPLEPDEMEKLLGFPRDHTRGGGCTKTNRYKSLGNSFQVDTVAYHLSVLKPLFPKGINVLSLFTGIGGGEVALHRLEIPMNLVVSVEISEVNRNILRCFWDQTNQKGTLIEFEDVQKINRKIIEQLMDQYGAFDLVIGGSPCNNISGANRYTRSGLEGKQSSLFYDYCRILKIVRCKAAKMRR